jgi:hypothetical protein
MKQTIREWLPTLVVAEKHSEDTEYAPDIAIEEVLNPYS